MKTHKNDPNRAGASIPGSIAYFPGVSGAHHRYCVRAVHTRFDAVEYVVSDADQADPVTDGAAIIRQSSSAEEALRGLGAPRRVRSLFGLSTPLPDLFLLGRTGNPYPAEAEARHAKELAPEWRVSVMVANIAYLGLTAGIETIRELMVQIRNVDFDEELPDDKLRDMLLGIAEDLWNAGMIAVADGRAALTIDTKLKCRAHASRDRERATA